MIIKVNGVESAFEKVCTVQELIQSLGYEGDYFAVAVNMSCVPRSHYSKIELKDQDSVEILSPMQGG